MSKQQYYTFSNVFELVTENKCYEKVAVAKKLAGACPRTPGRAGMLP